MYILIKIACFFGLHEWMDCDECEAPDNVSIMEKCNNCGKVRQSY